MVLPAQNRAVVYSGDRKVTVTNMGPPKMVEVPTGQPAEHGVIIKVMLAAICGSDMHMFRGRAEIPQGTPLGHEMMGEVVHCGKAVKSLKEGDVVIVPFNVSCGMCENCLKQNTHICLRANEMMPGGAYGYSMMGNWQGHQAEYSFVPWADFQVLKIANKQLAMEHIFDLTLCTDVLPTAMHTAVMAKVGIGRTVYIAGAGPVGTAAAKICQELLGAARVIVGDVNPQRLTKFRQMKGIETIDLSREKNLSQAIQGILGFPRVDCVLECVGFDGGSIKEVPEQQKMMDLWGQLLDICEFGGNLHITGVYMPKDLKGPDQFAAQGILPFPVGQLFAKGITITCGQCPVARYLFDLVNCIMHRGFSVYQLLQPKVVSLDNAPMAYDRFERGEPAKFFIDPHGMVRDYYRNKPNCGVEFM